MDFFDPKKKRAHKIRLYIGYALMALVLIMGSAVLFFEASGFDLDRETGEIIQNGLVFVDAHPESAQVFVNGKLEGATDTRLTIPGGQYTFEFKRDGYRTWSRSFNLGGSEIERLNYAFLFPSKLNPAPVRSYAAAPSFATQSPDRKWVLIQQPNTLGTFDLLDLSNQQNPVATSFTLPAGTLNTAGTIHKIELVEWSNDNRRLIVKHTHANGMEFIMIDREEPQESLNLNKHFNLPLYSVALRDKKFDRLHILDKPGGTLRFIELASKRASVIASKVYQYKSYGEDVVLYITTVNAKKGQVIAAVRQGRTTHTIRELSTDPKSRYLVDITKYDDQWYMAVSSPAEKKVYIYHDVFRDFEATPSRKPFPLAVFRTKQNVEQVSISANTRFISVQAGSEFAVYDAEHDRQYQYDTKLDLKGQKAKWMDGHRLTAVIGNKLVVWEYDGINKQTLVDVRSGFVPFFDRDYDFLYTLSPSTTSTSSAAQTDFNKTPMRTEADL